MHIIKMRLARWFPTALILSVWLWGCSSNAAQLPQEVDTVFQELDRLSPPGIWSKPIVRLEIAIAANQGPQVNSFRSGLLIEQTDQRVSIWDPSLESVDFAKMPSEVADEPYVVSMKTISLDEQIQFFKNEVFEKDRDSPLRFRTPEILESMIWGRIAHSLGQFEPRDQLVKTVKLRLDKSSLKELIEISIPVGKHEDITRHLEDPKIPRIAVLTELNAYLQRFPTSPTLKEAVELRDNLRLLVEEESKRAAAVKSESLTKEERIDGLIFRLCDINVPVLRSFGFARVALELNNHPYETEPCWQLYRMGFDAVPNLIEAISDSRPTRLKDDSSRITRVNLRFASIGQMAELILYRIAGGVVPISEGSISDRQAAYRALYAEVQKVGSKTYLMNAVARGGKSVDFQAVLLSSMYPEAALEPIKQAIRRTDVLQTREALYHVASKLGDQGSEYLASQLLTEKGLHMQVAIAELLRETKGDIAFEFVLKRFEEYRDLEINKNSKFYTDGTYVSYLSTLVRYLAKTDRNDALIAIEKSFDSLPAEVKKEIAFSMTRDVTGIPIDVLDSMERLLIKALADTESDYIWNEDDRVCDAAALALIRLFPAKYQLMSISNPHDKDRERLKAINAYRSRFSLPPVPTPSLP